MKDIITLKVEATVPEYTKSIEINFSRGAFKDAIKLNKLKSDIAKAQNRLISRFYNNAPIKYGIPSVPFGTYALHRDLIKYEAGIKWDARILYLTYAFIRGVPRHVLEKKRDVHINSIVNGIRDKLSFDNLLSNREALTNKIREWYLTEEEENESN